MSKRRRVLVGIVTAVIVTVVVVAAGAIVSQQADTRTAAVSEPAETPSPGPVSQVPAPATAPPDDSAGTGETGTDEADTNQAERGETPGATGAEAAPSPAPESTPPALVTMPLPSTSTAVGSVVAGFPVQVIPEAPDSVIDASSVTSEGAQLQAALTGQTPRTADEVLGFYRAALAALGLTEAPAPAPDGSSALTFTRGANNIALTVTPIDGGCRYAVFGTFTAES